MPDDDDIPYDLIVERIQKGRCVPFLGAGVNASIRNDQGEEMYKGLPLASEVALHLTKVLLDDNLKSELEKLTTAAAKDIKLRLVEKTAGLSEDEMQKLRNLEDKEFDLHLKTAGLLKKAGLLPSLLTAGLPDLARIALHVEVKKDFDFLMNRLREVIPDTDDYEPSPSLEKLASLPFRLLVTANYDRLLERAIEKQATNLKDRPAETSFSTSGSKSESSTSDKPYELVIQPVRGFTEQEQQNIQASLSTTEKPIIYKIHGSFTDTDGETAYKEDSTLVLTEEDYIQFLSVVGRQDLGVPTLVKEKLIKSTILFLGYSLQDWDFRTIFKTLIEPLPEKQRPRSFAIQKDPPDFWVDYWEKKKVTIIKKDLYEFASELEAKYWPQKTDG
jgi:hypothetical protein